MDENPILGSTSPQNNHSTTSAADIAPNNTTLTSTSPQNNHSTTSAADITPNNTTTNTTPRPPLAATTITTFILHTTASFYPTYILPVTLTLGLFGNAFTCVSIIKQKLYSKSTIFAFIAFISACDFIYLFSHSSVELLEVYFNVNLLYDRLCKARMHINKISGTSSVWILILCSAVKLYAMAFPLKAIKRDTKRLAVITCVVIIIVIGVIYIPLMLNARFLPVAIVEIDNITYVLQECTIYRGDMDMYNAIITLTMCAYIAVPGILLFLLSIAILVTFVQSYRRHKQLTESTTNSEVAHDAFSSARNSVLVLIPMSIIHIVVSLPAYVVIILTTYGVKTVPKDPTTQILSFYLTQRFIDLNHSVNLYVQLCISKYYRQSIFGINHNK